MEIKFKLLPPIMPNFLKYEAPSGNLRAEINGVTSIAVSDLTAEQAKQYGQLMADEFFRHWQIKVAQKVNGK